MPIKSVENKREDAIILTICDCHIKRIGVFRAFFGAIPMYLSIPVWVLLHLTTVTFLYQRIFGPLFKLPKVSWKDHVILDRNLIEGLVLADKINCLFCGYANGITTMINKEVDNLAKFDGKLGTLSYLAASLTALISVPILLVCEILGIQIVYNLLVAPALGMHKTSYFEVERMLKKSDYGSQYPELSRNILLFAKNIFLRFSMLLEQIESSWCPLQHLEKREGVIYPDHHRNFFRPDELEKMRETLSTKGTASDKLPLY